MAGPYEYLAIKLWETIFDKGVCGIFRPGQMKREGLANAEVARAQIIMLAQAEKEADDIKNGRLTARLEHGELVLKNNVDKYEPIIDLPSMYAAMQDDIVLRRVHGEINLAKTILKAEQELLNVKGEAPEEDVELDWINRWRDYAYNVSSDEVQLLWAKLLAGEIKSPGRFSFRTMEFLKNLTKQEAKEIEVVLPFIFKEGFIYRGFLGEGVNGNNGRAIHNWLSWDVLSRMQEFGIVQDIHEERATITLLSKPNEKYFLRSANKAIIYEIPEGKQCTLTHISVTRLGIELLEIAGGISNNDYILKVADSIKKSGCAVSVSDYNELSGGRIECSNIQNI